MADAGAGFADVMDYDPSIGGDLEQILKFHVPVRPKGQPRPRWDSRSGRMFTPTDAVQYAKLIREAAIASYTHGAPYEDPMRVQIRFLMKPPKTKNKAQRSRPHNRKPDLDNAIKPILDALNPHADKPYFCGVWLDDVQVVDLRVRKDWHPEHEGVTVWVWRIR